MSNFRLVGKERKEMYMKKFSLMMAAAMLSCGIMTTSCKDDEDETAVMNPKQQVMLSCERPGYLQAGDKVALISP